VLAPGSRPVSLPGLEPISPRIWDSTEALQLPSIPKRLLVVGGGYIGLELGTVYAALGSKVTLVELTDGLLPGADRDLVGPVEERARELFAKVLLETRVAEAKEDEDQVTVQLETGERRHRATFDRVLVAVGRRPNTDYPGLEAAGVETDERGFILVDEHRQTNVPGIYAIGDAAGQPMLAHKASREGKVVAEHVAGAPAAFDPRAIPAVVFTLPEVAWCGLTETQAQQEGRTVKVARFPWTSSGRAVAQGVPQGQTKLLLDPDTDRILGAGIVGEGASEFIAEATLAIEMGAVAEDLAMTIHPHPTFSETLMETAETAIDACIHRLASRKPSRPTDD